MTHAFSKMYLTSKCRISLLTCFISSVLLITAASGQFNGITIQIHKDNHSSTLLKAITLKNETFITDIHIEEEDVPILKTGVFESLFLLRTVYIQRTNLAVLEEKVFAGLRRIRNINLNFNRIHHVPANVFKSIPVYAIALRGNGIKTLSEYAFFNLPNLQMLDLGTNDIELLPKNLFVHTSNLKRLDLSFNKLRHFPAVPYRPYAFFDVAFANMVQDESSLLDLSNNNFTFVSYYLLRGIHYIRELKLNNNGIRSISEYAFDDFKKVNRLDLEGNDLEELSDGLLGVLASVDDINVANNPWSRQFVCKYGDWCDTNKKANFMEERCPAEWIH